MTFTSTIPNLPLNSIFINNYPSLNSYSDYFLNEWEPNFSKMESHFINLAKDKGEQFYHPKSLMHKSGDKAQRMKFLKKIGLISEYDMCPSTLSKREKELIAHYLIGKSASQIGLSLGLSTRTIEHYINNIKFKLGCNTKQELFLILQTYQNHNLL